MPLSFISLTPGLAGRAFGFSFKSIYDSELFALPSRNGLELAGLCIVCALLKVVDLGAMFSC